jgi:predicted dehydrogenase
LQERYAAAVIGGGVGGKLSAAALAASVRFELVALADTRAEARAECAALYLGITTFATHQELFAHHATDLVCVATYPPRTCPSRLMPSGCR